MGSARTRRRSRARQRSGSATQIPSGRGLVPPYETMTMERTCNRCKRTLDISRFPRRHDGQHKPRYTCRDCYRKERRERDRQRRERNPAVAKAPAAPAAAASLPPIDPVSSTTPPTAPAAADRPRVNSRYTALDSTVIGQKIAAGEPISTEIGVFHASLLDLLCDQLWRFHATGLELDQRPILREKLATARHQVQRELQVLMVLVRKLKAKPRVDPRESYTIFARRDGQRQARAVLALPTEGPLTQDQIKKAYIDKMKKCHPDHGGTTEDAQNTSAARAVLLKEITNG